MLLHTTKRAAILNDYERLSKHKFAFFDFLVKDFTWAYGLFNESFISQRESSMNTIKKNSIALTLGAVVVGTAGLAAPEASANPFGFETMTAGYQLDAGEGKCGEGKCGEGKCGGDAKGKKEGKCGEGKCGGDAKGKKEGKCGEGKCGGDAKGKKEGKCGEGKCGGDAKGKKEGKCGEGKCGGDAKGKKEGKCGEGKCGGSH